MDFKKKKPPPIILALVLLLLALALLLLWIYILSNIGEIPPSIAPDIALLIALTVAKSLLILVLPEKSLTINLSKAEKYGRVFQLADGIYGAIGD